MHAANDGCTWERDDGKANRSQHRRGSSRGAEVAVRWSRRVSDGTTIAGPVVRRPWQWLAMLVGGTRALCKGVRGLHGRQTLA